MATNAAELAYQRWRRDYRQYCGRRNSFQQDVMQAWKAAFDAAVAEAGTSLALPRVSVHARRRRATLRSRFCMLLWSRNVDEAVFTKYAEGADLGCGRQDALSLLRYKATKFRPRIARLTAHLDLAGFFALMLWPKGQRRPSGPFVLKAPAGPVDIEAPAQMDMWFYVFTGLVELAQAIIVEGNYGIGLTTELGHIEKLGLSNRILLFDNSGELYRFDDNHRWPLERIGDAVAFAAAGTSAGAAEALVCLRV
jgi:hypothetical protein